MRRKRILLLLCSFLVLCLVACGKEKTDTGESSEITVETEKKEVVSEVTEKLIDARSARNVFCTSSYPYGVQPAGWLQ